LGQHPGFYDLVNGSKLNLLPKFCILDFGKKFFLAGFAERLVCIFEIRVYHFHFPKKPDCPQINRIDRRPGKGAICNLDSVAIQIAIQMLPILISSFYLRKKQTKSRHILQFLLKSIRFGFSPHSCKLLRIRKNRIFQSNLGSGT